MSVTRIFGSPGTGKTHYLQGVLTNVLDSGIRLADIAVITHTRNARWEFKGRAMRSLGDTVPKTAFRYFNTMHALSWLSLGLNVKENALTASRYKEFISTLTPNDLYKEMHDIAVLRRNADLRNDEAGYAELGSITGLFADVHDINVFTPYGTKRIDVEDIIGYSSLFEQHMIDNELYDYTKQLEEYLISLHDFPHVDFSQLICDEFQDYGLLQAHIYEKLVSIVDDTYLAGDQFQSLYRYAGGSPTLFTDTHADSDVILPQTYRFGDAILDNSIKYIMPLSNYVDNHILPADKPSRVIRLRGKEWMGRFKKDRNTALLTRTNADAYFVGGILDRMGVLYSMVGDTDSNVEKMIKYYNGLSRLQNGESIYMETAKMIASALPAFINRSAQTTLTGGTNVNRVRLLQNGIKKRIKDNTLSYDGAQVNSQHFADLFLDGWNFDELPLYTYIPDLNKFIVDKKLEYPTPAHLTINTFVSTVHKAKGSEYDIVFYFAQLPQFIYREAVDNQVSLADELMISYVASSRARDVLFEVSGFLRSRTGQTQRDIYSLL